jgi:hypothetical protein
VRETQSLLTLCAECWKRPALLGWEILWRWGFGVPALLLISYVLWPAVSHAVTALSSLSFSDPMQAGTQLAAVAAALKPELARLARWLTPLLLGAWAVASGLGRNALLRRLDPMLRPAPGTLIALQLLRGLFLLGALVGWYRALVWAANVTLDSSRPNLVGWSAFVICLSLAVFVLWALISWVFSIAPVVAMIENQGILGSLRRSLRLGPLRRKLIEINLGLGIVRLALAVLAMVFSAIPLPFLTAPGGLSLYLWWAIGALLYLAAGDFFQVVRLAACVQLCQAR